MAFVPPGGFTGFSQMTPASRARLMQGTKGIAQRGKRRTRTVGAYASGAVGVRRKRKSIRDNARVRLRSRKRRPGRRMKFGSPAWQKFYKVGKFRK